MTTVGKGKITSIVDETAVVQPHEMGSALTPPLPNQTITVNIPDIVYANGDLSHTHVSFNVSVRHPILEINKDVVFVLFDDGTGTILGDA